VSMFPPQLVPMSLSLLSCDRIRGDSTRDGMASVVDGKNTERRLSLKLSLKNHRRLIVDADHCLFVLARIRDLRRAAE
jgi:hypothetical protein